MHIMYIEDVELTGGGYEIDEVIERRKNVVYTQGKLFIGQDRLCFPAVAKFTKHNKGVIIGFNKEKDCDSCCDYFNLLIGDNGALAMSILRRTVERLLVCIMAVFTAINLFLCFRHILANPFFDRHILIVPLICVLILALSVKYVFFKPGALHMFQEGK